VIASGVIVLDKPTGLSSAQAVDSVKRALGAKRAGHAGTLDPIATGVLPICINEATKIAGFMLAEDKAYEAEMVLGVETDTLDRTGNPTATRPVDVTREQIVAALAARTGEYDQVPPMFSAIKRDGVRLYARARAGEHIEIEPRRIKIASLELLAHDGARVRFAVACSQGT
jgi:tRNA pseudouridine55 synthase